jgi:hypothetical protein
VPRASRPDHNFAQLRLAQWRHIDLQMHSEKRFVSLQLAEKIGAHAHQCIQSRIGNTLPNYLRKSVALALLSAHVQLLALVDIEDLDINGQKTPVGLKADRNGFFYVLNRQTGALISAQPFVLVNWAKEIDLKSGLPVEVPEKRPRLDVWAKDICPNLFGGGAQ